ncbi:MAG TPA: VWA domain-containing protein, partial [Tepidisphaeraceae bacterium]|nr:VWA domain-containing protein [Tepidisphaeraceae bacterium]
LLIVPAGFAARRHFHHLREIRRRFNLGSRIADVSRLNSGFRSILGPAVLGILSLLLIVALARPQLQTFHLTEVTRKLDVVFVLDTSPSMQAQDILPSRLERARYFIKEVVTRQSLIDRVGLVTFSGSSLILSYLTSDAENILFYLDYLVAEPPSSWGTDLGAALESGLKVIEAAAGKDNEPLQGNRKAIILLSDGEDHGEGLRKTLGELAQKGIRVYTVGIGSAGGGFIPMATPEGKIEYLLDSHGARLVSRLNEATLRQIAQLTGGRFYRSFEGSEIGAALQEILSREREVLGYRQERDWVDLYRPLISSAAALMLAALVLGKG